LFVHEVSTGKLLYDCMIAAPYEQFMSHIMARKANG
jgi:hypothetical protein